MAKALPSANCHGLIADRLELFSLLGRSKVLVSPSAFDPAPGILWEASALGCNVIASRNCGNWMLCNTELLAESGQPDEFAAKIRQALHVKFEDNMQLFLDAESYSDLVETITLEAGA
jgi:glycosyltransferase involved in cell wall biosynthesis